MTPRILHVAPQTCTAVPRSPAGPICIVITGVLFITNIIDWLFIKELEMYLNIYFFKRVQPPGNHATVATLGKLSTNRPILAGKIVSSSNHACGNPETIRSFGRALYPTNTLANATEYVSQIFLEHSDPNAGPP